MFVAGFAYSWGLIVWVLGTEVQSLETRSAGMSVSGAGVEAGAAGPRRSPAASLASWAAGLHCAASAPSLCAPQIVIACNFMMSYVYGEAALRPQAEGGRQLVAAGRESCQDGRQDALPALRA